MNLLRIGALYWSVCVTEDLLKFLNDWSRAKQPKVNMVSFLMNSVPMGGPQESNPIVCKSVSGSDGLFYFRKGKRHGEKVRVFWFYGDDTRRQVICVWGCVKTQRRLDPEDIGIALAARKLHGVAVAKKELTIDDVVPRRKQTR